MAGEAGFSILASASAERGDRAGQRRHRHLRGVPGRGRRPDRSPLPLPLHQLHGLRSPVHDRPVGALRPAGHDDGRLHDVPGVPGRVRRPVGPAVPRPAQRVPAVRPAAVVVPARGGARRGERRRSRPRRGGRGAPRRRDRGGEGDRWLPPGRRRHRRGGRGGAPASQGPRRQALRRDGARPRGGGGPVRAERRGRRGAHVHRSTDRAGAAAARRAGGPVRRAGAARPRPPPPVLAAAPPAPGGRRPTPGDDQRQPQRRAHRPHGRRCAHPPRRSRRRRARTRPGDPHPVRRLRRARPRRRTDPGPPSLPGHGAPAGAARPRHGSADPGGRRRAQGHGRRGVRGRRGGEPSHRRPRAPRDVPVVPPGHRSPARALRRHARGRRPRPAPRVPLHEAGDGPRPTDRRGAAPPRPRGVVPHRARPPRTGARPGLRRPRLRHRRDVVGRGAARGRPRRASNGSATWPPSRCPGEPPPSASRGAWGWRGRTGPASTIPSTTRATRRCSTSPSGGTDR